MAMFRNPSRAFACWVGDRAASGLMALLCVIVAAGVAAGPGRPAVDPTPAG